MSDDGYGKKWITEKALEVLKEYTDQITVRQLYYRLVAQGLPNNVNHYKRVVVAMTDARWDDIVEFRAFIDRERSLYGNTDVDEKSVELEITRAKNQIEAWMNSYHLNRWSNQDEYIEVWIEKKALQGVFESPCDRMDVGLAPCKGYPSLTFLDDACGRFENAQSMDKRTTILYFGDADPSGDDIPRSVEENLRRMGCDINVERVALNPDQIVSMGLPGVPAKLTDTRSRNWDGDSVVELDAVEPKTLTKMVEEAIRKHFDEDAYQELMDREDEERKEYREKLKEFVTKIGDDNKK